MFQEVASFLHPFFGRESEREALLLNAFYGHEAVLGKINYAGAASEFVPRLIRVLQSYGEITPGTQALWQLLLTVRAQVGSDRQQQIDSFKPWANTAHLVTLQPGDLAGSTVINNDNRTTITGGQFGALNNYGAQTNNFGPQTNQTTQSGNNVSVSGNNNTVAGGNIDQSRHNSPNIRIGGSVQGGNINFGNQTVHGDLTVTIRDMTQTVQKGSGTPSDKEQLQQLLDQLKAALAAVPEAHKANAEKVAKRTEELVTEVSEADVDKDGVESKANLLKKAAENIKEALPDVFAIAGSIVAFGLRFVGVGL